MTKKIVDEQIKLSIIIDGNEAQKELHDLEKSTRDLNSENKELLIQKRKLEKQGKQESASYLNVTKSIKENNKAIRENKTRMNELQNQIGLTGLTMGQLKSKANLLKTTLNNLIPGSADYIKYENELKGISARMEELRGKAQVTAFSLGGVADKFNRYAALGASVIATLTGIVISVQQILDYNGKLSDSQSDVMKTTGLTKKEVDELTKSFGLLKTRSARMELLKLAEEGGRLGIEGADNIMKWVNVANQLKVALGDDLSETQIREVGKMVQVFKVGEETGRDFEGAMLSLGSAINEVSASGSNDAGFLIDFMKRTGGISVQAKLASADNLAYAATFDEIGQSAEVSGTVMNKLLTDMFIEPGAYAKIAGMELGSFTNLLKTDVNGAMIAFLKGLDGNNAGLEILGARMSDLDIGGSRGVAAVAGLASNLQILEARQATSNQAMMEATSLTNEYAIKNNNLAATLDKIKKVVVGWYSSETFIQWLTDGVDWFARFIGATEDSDGKMAKFKNGLVLTTKIFAVLLASMITNVAWQKLVALWTTRTHSANLLYIVGMKGRALAENIAKIGTLSYIAITSLFTGNIKTATIALRGLTVALATTPWGAILAIVAAVTTAFILFSEETQKVTWAQKELRKAQSDVVVEIKKETDYLNNLIRVAQDEKRSKEQRQDAIKAINEISPEYLGNITLENIKTQQTTKAVNSYIRALDKKLKLQAVEKTLEATYDKEKELKGKDKSDYMKWYDYLMNGWYDIDKTAENRKSEDLRQLFEDRRSLMFEMGKMMEEDPTLSSSNTPNDTTTYSPINDTKKGKKSDAQKEAEKEAEIQKRAHEKRLEEIKKYHEEKLKLDREFEDGNFSLMDETYAREKQILETEHKRKVEDLKLKLIDVSEIEKAEAEAKNLKLTESQRKSYSELSKAWLETNQSIYRKVEQETNLHCLKLGTLVQKYSVSEVDLIQQKYDQEKLLRDISYNNQLEEAGNNKKKRENIENEYRKSNYDFEIKHLESIVKLYNDILSNEEINGIDFDLLSSEDEKKLKEDLEKVKLAISELYAAKSGEGKNKESKLGNGEASLGLNQTDILGFTSDQWETFTENIKNGTIGIETMTMAVQLLGNMWSQYSEMVEAGENRRMKQFEEKSSQKETRLKRQLDVGLISQEQYNKAVEDIEADVSRKKADLEYKQAKRKRTMDMANVIVNTSLAIMQAYAQMGPIAGTVAAVLMGTIGAFQLATIAKQPLPAPGYEDGLYSNDIVKRQQDGKVFKSTFGGKTKSGVVTKPTHFLTGENGPEMIIDSKAYRQMNPDLRNSLIRELRGIKGFENGYYNSDLDRIDIPSEASNNNSEIISVLGRVAVVLEEIEKNGVSAYVSSNDKRSMKNLKQGIEEFNNFKNRNKVS